MSAKSLLLAPFDNPAFGAERAGVDPRSIGRKIMELGSIPHPPPKPEILYSSMPEDDYGSSSELEKILEQKFPGWRDFPPSVQSRLREMVLEQGSIPIMAPSDQPPAMQEMGPVSAPNAEKIFMPNSFRVGGRVGLI